MQLLDVCNCMLLLTQSGSNHIAASMCIFIVSLDGFNFVKRLMIEKESDGLKKCAFDNALTFIPEPAM